MKYTDPFIGEVELIKVGESTNNGLGEFVSRTVYYEPITKNYYIDIISSAGYFGSQKMIIINKDVAKIITNYENNINE